MSLENHPNFHAVKFTSDIMVSYFKCLRGKAEIKNDSDITEEVIEFVMKIEKMVDKKCEEKHE
jgi:hypothetical protein